MEDSGQKRWPVAWVVIAIVGSMSLLGYLSIRFMPSAADTAALSNPRGYPTQQASYSTATPDWVDDTGTLATPVKMEHILHRDIETRIGKAIVTYRGFDGSAKIKLDVVILELDPDVTYSRIIQVDRAKGGFRLGEESFELISARKLRLYVWHYE